MNRKEGGFTLIELLVVIAIIGILSSVVLASLNSARQKAQNARIKAQLSSARAAAEIYNDNNNGYGAASACNAGMFADSVSGMNKYSDYTQYPGLSSGDIACFSSNAAWSMSAKMPVAESGGTYWCVGSAGIAKSIASAVTTATSCQ